MPIRIDMREAGLFLVLVAVLAGCASEGGEAPAAARASLTDKLPNQLVLNYLDLPEGWTAKGDSAVEREEAGFLGGHSSRVENYQVSYQYIDSTALVFTTSTNASAYYDSLALAAQQHSPRPKDVGDRALAWDTTGSGRMPELIVQKENVVWEVKALDVRDYETVGHILVSKF